MNKFSYVKKILYLLIAILILQSKNIEPAGENFTPIYTQKDLEFISNNLDGNFILMNDITISGIWDPIGSNEWTPISKNFKGVFDGNGHVIRNLSFDITFGSRNGLFSINEGTIKNLGIEDSDISVTLDELENFFYLGFIAGVNYGSIDNCYNTSSINISSKSEVVSVIAGGIAGMQALENSITKGSFNTGSISVILKDDALQTVTIGGIVGQLSGGNASKITHCYNTGRIYGDGSVVYAAGIAGEGSIIEYCYNIGGITAFSDDIYGYGLSCASGISTYGTVNKCYNTGPVKGLTNGGGILALTGNVRDSFNAGSVISTYIAGGISGYRNNSNIADVAYITNCYNIGTISGRSDYSTHGVGFNNKGSVLKNTYHLNTLTGNSSENETTLTISQMEQKDSFKGFDFEQIWAISPHEEYTLPILKELPMPIVENITDFAGGNGTFYNPYKISTKAHLNNVRNYTNANFIMIDDIAFAASDFALDGEYYNEGKGWIPICRDRYDVDFDYFSGVFDGNGHTVANLYSKGEYAGLFGANYGTIKDLGVINGDINGQASAGITVTNELTGQILNCYFTGKIFAEESAGGICASSGALINNCYSTAEVVSNGSAGGIVSFAYNSKGISDCFFSGSVSGKEAGGIAGGTTLTNIVNSVNVGTVKGNLMVGGLVGRLGGSVINNSVNLGIVKDGTYKGAIAGYCDGPINNCYYNDIGLRATSWHVSGEINAKYLTSLQFKQKSSYPTFNFNEIWRLDEGMEYPMLKLMKI